MKTSIIVILLILLLVADGLLWRRVVALEDAAAAPKDFPLGETMGYLQRYADKLWYAGSAGNWDLARYYHDEIKETADEIESSAVVKDGVEISATMRTELPPALRTLDEAIAARDSAQFRERYEAMIASCNACHVTAKHPFIHVTRPASPPDQWNQDFAPSR